MFWRQCNFYRITANRKRLAHILYDEYIDDAAPRQINIDADIRCRISQRLNEAPRDLYDEAQKHIRELMRRDPYKRFVEWFESPASVQRQNDELGRHSVSSHEERGGLIRKMWLGVKRSVFRWRPRKTNMTKSHTERDLSIRTVDDVGCAEAADVEVRHLDECGYWRETLATERKVTSSNSAVVGQLTSHLSNVRRPTVDSTCQTSNETSSVSPLDATSLTTTSSLPPRKLSRCSCRLDASALSSDVDFPSNRRRRRRRRRRSSSRVDGVERHCLDLSSSSSEVPWPLLLQRLGPYIARFSEKTEDQRTAVPPRVIVRRSASFRREENRRSITPALSVNDAGRSRDYMRSSKTRRRRSNVTMTSAKAVCGERLLAFVGDATHRQTVCYL